MAHGKRRKADFIRNMSFDLFCPGNSDPDAEGKRRFRECIFSLMICLAEWIVDSEAAFIVPSKKMEKGSGFPFAIKLSIDQSWWNYLITIEANSYDTNIPPVDR